jgi:CHAT domain/SIR2-like domain
MAIIEFSIKLDRVDPAAKPDACIVMVTWIDGRGRMHQETGLTSFDFPTLEATGHDSEQYGKSLTSGLFYDPKVLDAFQKAQEAARGQFLRVRLTVSDRCSELHDLRWETLRDPESPHDVLTTHAQFLFSRYLEGESDRWTGEPQPLQDLRALVVVSAPSDLANYLTDKEWLTPFNAQEWADSALEDLGRLKDHEVLGIEQPATLDSITKALQCDIEPDRPGFDILYIVCHGALVNGDARLYLERLVEKNGKSVRVVSDESGRELATRIGELARRPQLVVVCACQSAGASNTRLSGPEWGMLAAFGPLLSQVGIPAVVAMQGKVPIPMVHRFLHTFLTQIQHHCLVDRAMSSARAVILTDFPQHYWKPTLYLRRCDIPWYTRGFMADDDFRMWPTIVDDIQAQKCTAVLGPGLNEPFFGSFRKLARRWASSPEHRFPLAQFLSDDLTQVAQFLQVSYRFRLRDKLERELCKTLLDLNVEAISDSLRSEYNRDLAVEKTLLTRLMIAVWEHRRAHTPSEAHQTLARLPFKYFITANPDPLMTRALSDAVSIRDKMLKRPREETFEWWQLRESLETPMRPPGFNADEPTPLVYHIFGRLSDWEHFPVTEDDYFSFLVEFGKKSKDTIPNDVQEALTDTSLLFLGFRLDDWSFRALLHALHSIKTARTNKGVRVAVQIAPEPDHMQDAQGAQKYLTDYFSQKQIIVYRGGTEEFLHGLWEAWQKR